MTVRRPCAFPAACLILSLVGGFVVPMGLAGQDASRATNVLYVEALGNALYGVSINYERMVLSSLSLRVGRSTFGAFPVMVNHVRGSGDHRAEVGAGLLVDPSEGRWGTMTLGYRYQPRSGGLVLRAGLTPLLGSGGAANWAGASIGVAF